MKTIDINVARKIVELLSHGLVAGLGYPEAGQMCVEAVVCQALDLSHGDDPGCVMQSLRAFKIKINDLPWSSRKARAEGLKRLALIQLGSVDMNEIHFVRELAKLAQKWKAAAADYDKVLANCAEDVVQLLISMNAPGKQWLELAPCAE